MRRISHGQAQDSTAVCNAVAHWLAARTNLKTIAVFSALRGEVDLADLVANHPDRTWVYPKVAGEFLTFHPVKNPALELVTGAFGILEPIATPAAVVPIDQIDAFFCPGIAFSRDGGRLGRGRGFYDRMLAQARPDALKIGVCFANQLVPDTFSQVHDIQMDTVIC